MTLSRLVAHSNWANATWMACVNGTAPDVRLRQLMSHILLSEQVWFQRVRGERLERELWHTLAPAEMESMHRRHEVVYQELLNGDLAEVISYERFTGERYRSPVSDILLHLCLHGMHHRGQMARHASEQHLSAPNTDFLNYCIVSGL